MNFVCLRKNNQLALKCKFIVSPFCVVFFFNQIPSFFLLITTVSVVSCSLVCNYGLGHCFIISISIVTSWHCSLLHNASHYIMMTASWSWLWPILKQCSHFLAVPFTVSLPLLHEQVLGHYVMTLFIAS